MVYGTGLFFLVYDNRVAINNDHATATTAPVTATRTANATATATGLKNVYNNATSGTPALDDPLWDNLNGYGWAEGTTIEGGTCAFKGGAYHVSQSNTHYVVSCAGGPSLQQLHL